MTLEPKGEWRGTDVQRSSVADEEPPVERRDLTYVGTDTELGRG
jgi:hypothetical protein